MSSTPAQVSTAIESSNPTTRVAAKIKQLMATGSLFLPLNYSPENALKSAWLILQTVQTTDKKPVLTACTQDSIINSLFEMAVQGLDPMKKQCYFIAHGNVLTCRRSYFGDEALAKRVKPGIEMYSDVIYKGENVVTRKVWQDKYGLVDTIVQHDHEFPRKSEEIIGAYCGFVEVDTGINLGVVLMSIDRMKKSWSMSSNSGSNNKLQNTFTDEAALRTVIRRRCKPIINSSNDQVLLSIIRMQDDNVEAEMAEEVAMLANQETLSIPASVGGEITQEMPKQEAVAVETGKEEAEF